MKNRNTILCLIFISAFINSYGQQEKIDSAAIEKERIRWNKSLVQDTAFKFNKNPNLLLVETIKDRKPGVALDLGMGQGRNTIYLAQQGWNVTGIDIADEAVAFALQRAKSENVKINTELIPMQKFEYGVNKWDLIVHVYEGCLQEKDKVEKILKSLKPGGLLVFEFIHRETGMEMNNPKLGCETNAVKEKILQTGGFNILTYSEEMGISDYFGTKRKPGTQSRLVKLVATKK